MGGCDSAPYGHAFHTRGSPMPMAVRVCDCQSRTCAASPRALHSLGWAGTRLTHKKCEMTADGNTWAAVILLPMAMQFILEARLCLCLYVYAIARPKLVLRRQGHC